MRTLPLLLGFLWTSALLAQPVEHAITRCTTAGLSPTSLELERCAEDVTENAMWQVDRSDSVSGELNGFAMRRTTGRGSVVYVIDTGILQRHDEFQRPDGDVVLGGFDAVRAAGLPSGCPPDSAVEPCGPPATVSHGTAVASAVAGLRTGTAPGASLYSVVVIPTRPGTPEIWMWHVALNEIIRHAWDAHTPSFGTAVVTISVPATPLPHDPLYLALVEKVRRMTRGVDVNGNEDPEGKKFLFTVAAGNVNPRADFCRTFPTVLGVEMEGVVTVGGITRENTWWSGSCAGDLVELVAPADSPMLASLSGVSRYRTGPSTSGTSFAAPYVAGIAARLLEVDPTLTPAALEALLKESPSRAADSGLAVPVLTIGMEMRKVR
ncbi:MAG TPA: S8 family serine peptidase [Thermoanaerobaculia bacterium]|nr:S8 family serine peptidase [Thermoanaerobaculia bacterium]